MEKTVKVRILVRVWADGSFCAFSKSTLDVCENRELLDFLQQVRPPEMTTTEIWLTAELPLPAMAEVAAQVEEPPHD